MSKKTKINKLKPIYSSAAIEKGYKKELASFSNAIVKSAKYWTLAQINKKERGDIESLSVALRIKFNALKNQWQSIANEYARNLSKKNVQRVKKYVNSNYISQGAQYKTRGLSKASKENLRLSIYEQMALIKSIPQEIIARFENALYNNIANYNQKEIIKTINQISNVSKKRAQLIARDQTAKAIESFQMSRARDLGFKFYQWHTSQDERVSKGNGGHIHLENRIYSYDNPSAVIDSKGTKGHPAQRVNCRCVAIPITLENNQKAILRKDSSAGDYYEIVEK